MSYCVDTTISACQMLAKGGERRRRLVIGLSYTSLREPESDELLMIMKDMADDIIEIIEYHTVELQVVIQGSTDVCL